jgi:hypothetical protein
VTVLSVDEWHTVEVGVPFVVQDEDGNDEESHQAVVKHSLDCPNEIHTSANWDGSVTTEVYFRCNLAVDGEYYGLSYWLDEVLDIKYGVWRVRARAEQDYWGEIDIEYEVERLEGPVDEREFEVYACEHHLPGMQENLA